MKYLWDARPRLHFSKKLILFLDFDGTVAVIAKHPDDAGLPAGMRRAILALRPSCLIVIISGRSIRDLKARCRLPGVVYIGNHGLQTAGLVLPVPARLKAALADTRCMPQVADSLRRLLGGFDGLLIENKGLTVSVHYRNLPPARRPAFARSIAACREALRRYPVIWRKGKKVWEVRPAHTWDKGDAVRRVLRRHPGHRAIAIGDDDTDEDMFRALGASGVSIRVGRRRASHARYFLKSPGDVEVFLKALKKK